MTRPLHLTGAAAVLLALATSVACGSATPDGSEPSTDPTPVTEEAADDDTTTTASEPTSSGADATAEVPGAQRSDLDVGAPADWEVWQVQRLVFAVPPGMAPSTDLQVPSAAATFVSPQDENGDVPAVLAVYVETGAVGPLEIRTDLTYEVRLDQIGEPFEPPDFVDVPGSAGAATLAYRFDDQLPVSGETVETLRLDVIVQVPDPGPQLGAFLLGASSSISEEDLRTFTDSLRVVDDVPTR